MQITLNQNDIEQAIRQYVTKMGITRPIDEISFTQTRKEGTQVGAEIELVDPDTVKAPTEVKTTRAVEEKPKAEKAPLEPVVDKDESSFVVEKDPEPQDDEAPEVESKSLFGKR